jgi:hypothetical protein
MNNLVEIIRNLPPLLKEEVIGKSMKAIEEDAEKKIIKEIRDSATIVVEDITELLISSSRTGKLWERPEYTKNINDELYYTFVDISEKFVNNHCEKLIFHTHTYSDDSDEDSY